MNAKQAKPRPCTHLRMDAACRFFVVLTAAAGWSASLHAAEAPRRSVDTLSTELSAVFNEARAAADKKQLKSLVVLSAPVKGVRSPALARFLQNTLFESFAEGAEIVQPPARVKAPPNVVTPAAISRLRWERGAVPAVLAVTVKIVRTQVEFSFAILDGKEQYWRGSFKINRGEIDSLPLIPPVNQRILDYAKKHSGQQVGNGECWTLANEALKAAAARRPATMVWGRKLSAGEEPLPGDVIQFTSVTFHSKKGTSHYGSPNHTAIIEQVQSPGVFLLLQQNMGGQKTVSEGTIDLATKTEGALAIYRPMAKRSVAIAGN
jgi:hypothetical protein